MSRTRHRKKITIELPTQLESYRKVRKPMPPAGKFHSSPKGKKGYDRKRDSARFRKEGGWNGG